MFTESGAADGDIVERQVLVTQLTTAREVVRVILSEVRVDELGVMGSLQLPHSHVLTLCPHITL